MRIVAIIQSRMGSSRLPGKVLLDIAGQPMLARVVERTRQARKVDEVVVATTTDPSDDAVVALCQRRGYPYYRGSLYDVLDRYYQTAKTFGAEVIVRITADCPLIDPGVIDRTVQEFMLAGVDFAANRLPPPWRRTYPIGLDTEVCTFAALERAWREADLPHHREHVMPYLYEPATSNQQLPGGSLSSTFRVLVVNHDVDGDRKSLGHLRWTVDTAEDLNLIRQIYAHFPGRDDFTWLDVLELVQHNPELGQINADVQHKTLRDVDERGAT